MDHFRVRKALRGGRLVVANQFSGMAISAVTAFLISRVMGPSTFAIFALCGSISTVTNALSRLGINAFMLTREQNPSQHEYNVALTSMMGGALLTGVLTIALLPLLERISHVSGLFWPGAATMGVLPFSILSLPAVTRMERDLKYSALVRVEFVAQLIGPGLGIILVLARFGVWGMIVGWFARTIYTAVASWTILKEKPHFDWDFEIARRTFKYGSRYLVSSSLDQSRHLVILLIAGRTLGQDAVGYLEVAVRAIRVITPIRTAVARIALPAMAPLVNSVQTVRAAAATIVETEVLLTVPLTLIAVRLYPLCASHILGRTWQPAIPILPWMAAGAILASPHACALSVLHIRGFFRETILSNLIHLICLAVVAYTLSRSFGLTGCAAAQIAAWPSLWLREWMASRRCGTLWSRNGILWSLGGASACFTGEYGGWFLLPLSVTAILTFPSVLKRVRSLAGRQEPCTSLI